MQRGSVSGPYHASIDAYVYIHTFNTNTQFQNSFEFLCTLRSQGVPLNIVPSISINNCFLGLSREFPRDSKPSSN